MIFDELLTARAALQAAHDTVWNTRHTAQAELDAALVAAAKAKAPDKKSKAKVRTIAHGTKYLSIDESNIVRAPFQAAWDLAYGAGVDALNANKLALQAASEAAEFSPVSERTEWQRWKSVWTSSYSTQGYGAATYAKNDAESYADKARQYGIEVEVRRVEKSKDRVRELTSVDSFDVYVKVAPGERDVALLGFKPEESLREWVRKCWARGSNPRVQNPWLKYEYEAENGLDYHGNDLRKPNNSPYRGTP